MGCALTSGSEGNSVSGEVEEGREREPRASRMLVGQLALEQGGVEKIRIRNVSSGGFGARSERNLAIGTKGHMLLSGAGLVTGQVVWTRGNHFGFQFDKPIDPELVRLSPPTKPTSQFVVPEQYRPSGDYKRPGFKVR